MAEQHSSEARLTRCVISRKGKRSLSLTKDMVAGISIHETIESPLMCGTITISDSKNFINDYPIQGGETVEMEMKTTFSELPIEYSFVVSKITNRYVKNKRQLYTLILVSPEFLVNESIRVQDPLEGNPETIVQKMLGKEYLNSSKEFFTRTI